jgi:hypothetical protein
LVCDVLDFVQRDTEKDSDKDTMKLDEDWAGHQLYIKTKKKRTLRGAKPRFITL